MIFHVINAISVPMNNFDDNIACVVDTVTERRLCRFANDGAYCFKVIVIYIKVLGCRIYYCKVKCYIMTLHSAHKTV